MPFLACYRAPVVHPPAKRVLYIPHEPLNPTTSPRPRKPLRTALIWLPWGDNMVAQCLASMPSGPQKSPCER